jgi:hypothetical protein
MNTNKNGIRILGGTTQRPERRRLYSCRHVVSSYKPAPAIDQHEPDVIDGLMEAFYELRTTLPSVIPAGQSINTRRGVPSIPTFKGVRYLGVLPFHQRMAIGLRNFGRNMMRTGVFAR